VRGDAGQVGAAGAMLDLDQRVDAAECANDLLYDSAAGRVSMLARFPAVAEQVPAGVFGNPAPITVDVQAVPTSVSATMARA
jgi:hypothetical protein